MTKPETMQTAKQIETLAKRINRPIVLVGMMGVGKSTIGRRLASLLHMPFTDADDAIEEAAQMSVSEIFERFGEDYFRDGERRVITRLLGEEPSIIATGGGAFCQDITRSLVLDKAISVWLDCDIETLVERVSRKDTRPLLHGGDTREIVTRLKQEREGFYTQASIHIISQDGPHQNTVLQILKAIDEWL